MTVAPLSVLDLAMMTEGRTPTETLADTVAVAQAAEAAGYARYWVPEHHNSTGLGFTSTEVMIAHLAASTRRIRVGAAGMMLPNHAPLKVAEVFRTLEALHPGRIDLGLGRAPGTDPLTAYALRGRDPGTAGQEFPELLALLLAFLDDAFPDDHPYAAVVAAPVGVGRPDLFVLGSSEYGPRFSAANGLPTVFAHHMSPTLAVEALLAYRRDFAPAVTLEPRAGISVLLHATDDPDEALRAKARWAMFMERLRSNRRGPGPTDDEVAAYAREHDLRGALDDRMYVGPPDEVAERVDALMRESRADELTLLSPDPDRARRAASLTGFARSWGAAATAAASPLLSRPA